MPNKYYVVRILHNGETGAEDLQKPAAFDDLESAKKEFHNMLATYIKYGKLDKVTVVLFDRDAHTIMAETWTAPEA